ncbi:unnamed protein product [Rhodiola kirilowii]
MAAHIGSSEVSLKHDCDVAEAGSIPEVASDGLQCNICFDLAHEPVVTLCGHLYCWPCIYKWLHVLQSYDESQQQPQCPICKANISEGTLVPLYGRDASSSESRATDQDLNIPNRPAFSSYNLQRLMQQSSQSANHWDDTSRGPHPSLATPSSLQIDFEAVSALLNPITCKFGEMVYDRIFGGSGANAHSYPYAASYPHMSSTNPIIQRQEKEVEKSLNRVSFFFFCCVLLCLFLF